MKTLIAVLAVSALSGCSLWRDINTFTMNNRDPSVSYVMTPNGGLYTIQSTSSGVNSISYLPGVRGR